MLEKIPLPLQTLQHQVPIGSKIKFSLKTGEQKSGVLIELALDHITLRNNGNIVTIVPDMIGVWEIIEDGMLKPEEQAPALQQPVDKNKETPILRKSDKTSAVKVETFSSLEDTDSFKAQQPKDNNAPILDGIERSKALKVKHLPPADNLDSFKRRIEIAARFEAQLQTAQIEIESPDFNFPIAELQFDADAAKRKERIKNQYENAAKIKELDPKFGRIRSILNDLRILVEHFPESQSVKRLLAYIYVLAGEEKEAIECYKHIAPVSESAYEWYNLAVVALKTKNKQEELACYSLEQFFSRSLINTELNAWYVYVGLLKKFSNYRALSILCKVKGHDFSGEEGKILLETGIYLLQVTDQEHTATELVRKSLEGQPINLLISKTFEQLGEHQPSESYQKIVSELNVVKGARKKLSNRKIQNQRQGYIHLYRADRSFGFLRGTDGRDYFFHRSAISDDDLFDKIKNLGRRGQISVIFEEAQGAKGPVAVGVSLYRTIDEMHELANKYASYGEYPKAIAQIKRVLDLNPEYPEAQELYEKWREYTRISGVPKGSNPFARAKRVQLIEKDLDRAAELFHLAIKQGDNIESAVKDLAQLLDQQGKSQEAIEILLKHRKKIQDQNSVDNMLIGFYKNAGRYDQPIELLQKRLDRAATQGKKAQVLWQIANIYLRKEDYIQAESNFKKILSIQPDNKTAQRHIAICLFKQKRYDEAEEMLNQILATSPDTQAATLLEAIIQAKVSGQSTQVDEIIIETTLSDFSDEISGFTQFFLKRCDFQGVPPDRVQKQSFNRGDVQKLEALATQLGTSRPRDRAGYYLSAAKIASILEEGDDSNQFYRYLCRSFASRGDATVIESRPLDAAREFYCEALNAYDGDRSHKKDEQDAVNALVRFMFSTLGQAQIPIKPHIPSIDETIENIFSRHPQRDKVFDAIAYLVLRSRYAANRILNRLYDKSSFQAMALEYLKAKGISVSGSIKRLDDFVRLWNELRRTSFDEDRSISNEIRFLAKVELTTASLENAVERAKALNHRLFFDLDQQRLTQLQKILETALDLCKQAIFEEQERLCFQIDGRCQDLLKEIEDSPTKFSIEEAYGVVQIIQKKVNNRLEELYQSSKPQLSLRLAVESYIPDSNQQIEVQIVVANLMGCSPSEALELVIQEDEDLFILNASDIKLDSSLRGGDQRILRVPICIREHALRSQAFSLPVYAQYRTRSEEIARTTIHNFSIRLDSETEFEEINNPFAAYAEGGVVGKSEMFYGRKELIENAARAIRESRTQSKCIVIFGQKRAGKSSILHHLKAKLATDNNLLILDLGNIGSILDVHSKAPLLYQTLWSILNKLEYAIEDKVERGFNPLSLSFPNAKEFYEHPSPLIFFKEIFERYKRSASRLENWCDIRAVLLIDEFSYIYGQIVSGRISELFMKNWKALLQENLFSAVLVGQDVMPKFKQRFPNEFGTTQDERVSYLKREDAIQLIDEPIRIGGRQGESRYREQAIERIVDLTAGSPFYIQIICNRLVEYMNRKRARLITEADVEQVKNELIRGVNALGLDKFDNLINPGDTSDDAISDDDTLKVLTTIAINSETGPCNRNSIACETQTPVDIILDDLVKRDVVERDRGQYYLIRAGLFKEWLIAHQ